MELRYHYGCKLVSHCGAEASPPTKKSTHQIAVTKSSVTLSHKKKPVNTIITYESTAVAIIV